MKKWPTEFPENYPDKELYENDFPAFNRKYNNVVQNEQTIHTPIKIFNIGCAEKFSRYWWKDILVYPFSSKGLFFDLYTFYHRGRYGWAPQDVWSFDIYLSRVIGSGLNHLSENNVGAPSGFPKYNSVDSINEEYDIDASTDFELWTTTLKKWSKSFSDYFYFNMNYGELSTYDTKYPVIDPENDPRNFNLSVVKERKLIQNISTTFSEMGKWFGNLWD